MKKHNLLKRRFEINGDYFVNAWFDRDRDFDIEILDYDGDSLDDGSFEHFQKHKDNEIKAALRDLCIEAPGRGIHYKSGVTVFVR